MFKQKLVLNDKQTEIIEWMIVHAHHTALETWQMLFSERNSREPDRCIAYYDNLNSIQKADVELVVARYFNLHAKGIGVKKSYKDLLYVEK
ncbi:hypothetical protein [Sporolactobacillus sp. KGMB 08714]|uniref:hypothetical protein n=1 Tax=Sporolactobacillus sp. KGMB 08714 TaxID=3064704 RepID=UPI002FBF0917